MKFEPCCSAPRLMRVSIAYLFVFLLISIAFILITTLIFFNFEDPTAYTGIAGKISLYLSCVTCGFMMSKKFRCKPLLTGIVLGSLIVLTVFILSLFVVSEQNGTMMLWYSLIPAATVFGALLGSRKSEKKRKKTHKRK